MSYNEHDMIAAAETHYRGAKALLDEADNDFESGAEWKAVTIANAHAEAAAGMLAMKLAEYAS